MPTVSLDFDGTLHPYTNGWQGTSGTVDPEPPSEDLAYVLADLRAAGCRLVIHSARACTPEGCAAILDWLTRHRLEEYITDITAIKPAAVVYLDDRALHFTGDWFASRDAILARLKEPR